MATADHSPAAKPREWEPWEKASREAFANALAATMDYLRGTYEDALKENAELRKRVTYLEQRLEEERSRAR